MNRKFHIAIALIGVVVGIAITAILGYLGIKISLWLILMLCIITLAIIIWLLWERIWRIYYYRKLMLRQKYQKLRYHQTGVNIKSLFVLRERTIDDLEKEHLENERRIREIENTLKGKTKGQNRVS